MVRFSVVDPRLTALQRFWPYPGLPHGGYAVPYTLARFTAQGPSARPRQPASDHAQAASNHVLSAERCDPEALAFFERHLGWAGHMVNRQTGKHGSLPGGCRQD